jgi:Flp pilus assembly protein TadD
MYRRSTQRQYKVRTERGSETTCHPQYDLGVLAQAAKRYSSAIRHYRKEIAQSGYHKAHYNLGVILQTCERYGKAIEEFEKATFGDPRLHEAYNNLGVCFSRLGQFRRALRAFAKAVRLKKGDAAYLANFGRTYKCVGQHEKAIATLRKAVAITPTHWPAVTLLGYMLLDRDRTVSEGIELLRKALRARPRDAQTLASLAIAHLKYGRLGSAARLADKAERIAPHDAFVKEQVRWVRTKKGTKPSRIRQTIPES